MSECERQKDSMRMLHRMIAYVREEAVRLRIMEVAVLLEHAEEAAMEFSPASARDGTRSPQQDCNRVDH